MGLKDLLSSLFKGAGHGVDELARRLGMHQAELRNVQPVYRTFTVLKRTGGVRRIDAPQRDLKALQRRILRRLLARLRCHPSATGFERGHSIVTNAVLHTGKPVVVRMDIKGFFGATRARRVEQYFRRIGWNRAAAALLTRICTHNGGLPQGAPTSPRLSNLVNYLLDVRLAAMAHACGAAYTRYADDLTFSFAQDDPATVRSMIRLTRIIAGEFGYELHRRRKLRVRRRHQQQRVTGLVVNERVNLPRATRRRLRAIDHHLRTNRRPTLTEQQFAGWQALREMIARQADAAPQPHH
jgi:retron-type reverse transcriptase